MLERWRLGRLGTTIVVDFSRGSSEIYNCICYFMMTELLGFAPERYCIVYNSITEPFDILLAGTLNYLPRHKIVIYPAPPPFLYKEFNPKTRACIYLFLRRRALFEAEFLADFGPPQPAFVGLIFRFRVPRRHC